MNPTYTVLLLRPEYLTDNYGQDTYLAHVNAATPEKAIAEARLLAMLADDANDKTDYMAEDGEDYAVLLVIAGHHDDINPEL